MTYEQQRLEEEKLLEQFHQINQTDHKVRDKLKALLEEVEKESQQVAFPVVAIKRDGSTVPKIQIINTKALLAHYNIDVRYNEMSKNREIDVPNTKFHQDTKENVTITFVHDLCRQQNYNISASELDNQLSLIASNNSYHPVADWIKSKKWDGIDRFPEILETVVSNHPMKEVLIRRWLLSAVAAVFERDGIAAQGMLVFVGEQGLGKTTWIKNLVGNKLWMKDGVSINTRDKDDRLKAVSYWIIELGELGSTFKKQDIDDLKSFITEDQDKIRPPYAMKFNQYARRTVIYGSVDRENFLEDDDNRRFWTLPVDKLIPFHQVDIQQLWAQMYQEYLDNADKTGGDVCWILTRDELKRLRDQNERFKSVDPEIDLVSSMFSNDPTRGSRKELNATEMLNYAGFKGQPQKRHTNKVSTWCRKNEFEFLRNSKKWIVYDVTGTPETTRKNMRLLDFEREMGNS